MNDCYNISKVYWGCIRVVALLINNLTENSVKILFTFFWRLLPEVKRLLLYKGTLLLWQNILHFMH